ncbi:MAG: hypothetical protein HY598_04510 [Candidatus Omnitrophica bacterium]|nr:hypothetical protein [Candidatus Omnitrophota bacterium]
MLCANAWAAKVEEINGLTVVYLEGRPYDIGRQHGQLLRQQVQAAVGQVLRHFRRYLKLPLVRTLAANWWLDAAWGRAAPFIPSEIWEELRGVAEGSGVAVRELYRLHAIPERTYSCANFAAWGRTTANGRLIHLRNLDWNIKAGIQQYPAVFVIHPIGKRAFVSVGWAGFVGLLTGVNEAQISLGQVGAATTDLSFAGEPMAFLMRRVLEHAGELDEASRIIREARRTVGVNYVVADAKARRAIAMETTHTLARVFAADDPQEHAVSYARPLPDAVLRADAAMDPAIRDRQTASRGDPQRPGLEDPAGSSAYDVRYLGQAAGLQARFGSLDPLAAQEIAKAVAPDSNIQSVIFAWPDLWVANAGAQTPAAKGAYHHLDLVRLLRRGEIR